MPREPCKLGCKNGLGKPRWHDSAAQCDYSPAYDPKTFRACTCRHLSNAPKPPEAGKPELQAQSADSSSSAKLPSPAPKATGGSQLARLEASPRAAEVVKTKTIIRPPAEAALYPDAPHTEAAVNFAFGVGYFVQCSFDDLLEWSAHMPRSQFRLSQLGIDTIRMEEKNFYSKSLGTLCWWAGCRTQVQAHAAIDTVLFFGTMGGFVVAVIRHNIKVYKESPKLKRGREKKKVEAEARRLARVTEGRVLSDTPVKVAA